MSSPQISHQNQGISALKTVGFGGCLYTASTKGVQATKSICIIGGRKGSAESGLLGTSQQPVIFSLSSFPEIQNKEKGISQHWMAFHGEAKGIHGIG